MGSILQQNAVTKCSSRRWRRSSRAQCSGPATRQTYAFIVTSNGARLVAVTTALQHNGRHRPLPSAAYRHTFGPRTGLGQILHPEEPAVRLHIGPEDAADLEADFEAGFLRLKAAG
jgi:cystathionine beta-lyase/cystathionine gamma-synthase